MRVACDDILFLVGLNQLRPEIIRFGICVGVPHPRSTIEGLDANHTETALSVTIVAMVLGKGLLKDGWPHGLVRTDLSKDCSKGSITIRFQRKVVINDDCVRDAKGPEVNGIDASRVQLVRGVVEDFLQATRNFSEGRSCRFVPAVAEEALPDIVDGDAIAAP